MEVLSGERLLANSGLERFKACSTFGALTDDAIRFLFIEGKILALQDGEMLFMTGGPADSFFVVLKGQIDTYREKDGEAIPIEAYTVGKQIGYVSMIGLLPRLGAGQARSETELLCISSELFYQLHLQFPFDFGVMLLNLSREMARTIGTLIGQYVEVCSDHSTS